MQRKKFSPVALEPRHTSLTNAQLTSQPQLGVESENGDAADAARHNRLELLGGLHAMNAIPRIVSSSAETLFDR